MEAARKTAAPSNQRLEMLKKWKEDKAKRKLEEKKNAKPIFKVCHISRDQGIPKSDKADKETKGKFVHSQEKKYVSKFAPKDHTFRAPQNVKPINFLKSAKTQALQNPTIQPQQRRVQPKRTCGTIPKDPKPKSAPVVPQKDPPRTKSQRIVPSKEPSGTENNKKAEAFKCVITKKTTITNKSNKKGVEWNVSEIDSSPPTPAKKTYQKTPRKRKPVKIDKNNEDKPNLVKKLTPVEKTPSKCEREVIYSDDEISLKTPVRKQKKSIFQIKNDQLDTETAVKSDETPANVEETILSSSKSEIMSNRRQTPQNTGKLLRNSEPLSPVAYISPFVTISRGKESARKEYKVRKSTGGTLPSTPNNEKDFSASTSPKMGAEYFRITLDREIDRIESVCREWEGYKENELPEEATNLIDVAVGQSKLLMAKKFKQFRDLIEECRSCQYKDKPITCTDLHGFWDMVYMQVENLDKRFASLETWKANNWQEVLPEKKITVQKQGRSRGRPKKGTATSSLKDAIRAARNKHKLNPEVIAENAIVLLTRTPLKEHPTPVPTSSNRKSLRVSLLAGSALKRTSSSPGLTMMKVTQAIKSGDGITPSRSILKTNANRSEKRITKSVLFKDDVDDKRVSDDDKENDGGLSDLINFSPVTPSRRSKRLSSKKS
ncbi:hypothetical protein JTB14_004139 [Gonioctena quinquepunctata]|nr:hypothetical protein JTB14_004139 [Gonioctena quinquepunctata]